MRVLLNWVVVGFYGASTEKHPELKDCKATLIDGGQRRPWDEIMNESMYSIPLPRIASFSPFFTFFVVCLVHNRAFVTQTALQAEWAPPEGTKWEEKDFEAQIKKLEAEAEERLDTKIAQMMGNVEKVGAKADY